MTVPATARAEAVTGRVYVAISRTNDRPPIQQTDTNGVPLFAVNVESLTPGAAATIDGAALGYPVKSLRELPAGDYWAQAFVNVYTKFARADGHTVWLHMDQIVNIYTDDNAYFIDRGWVKTERPNNRRPDGNITSMMKDENWYELVQGDRSRSSGQWDIWEATYGPVGADGYPQRIWDKTTGKIDKDVAAFWKEHYDLRHILESRWATLGPKVAHKINVYVGDADSYFLNMGVHLLDEFLKKADNPKWTGEVVFQPMAPHCWGPPRDQLAAKMAAQITKYAPAGADVTRWKY